MGHVPVKGLSSGPFTLHMRGGSLPFTRTCAVCSRTSGGYTAACVCVYLSLPVNAAGSHRDLSERH